MEDEHMNTKGRTTIVTKMTFDELRSILSDEINKLRNGDTTAVTVNAISNATGKYLSSVKLQLEMYKMLGQRPDVQGLLPDENEGDGTERIPGDSDTSGKK